MASSKSTLDLNLLKERANRARDRLSPCRLCPHECGSLRLNNETGQCGAGSLAVVSSAFPHHGEERCLRGTRGSGTIFFSGCNLSCVFCQNYTLSHLGEGSPHSAHEIASLALTLQETGCHNLNLVTPTHVIPQILDALMIAVENGFHLPIVYNCGGYESVETLRLLDGIVDIYMPDIKYSDPHAAARLSDAADYTEISRRAIVEMHRQVGDLRMDRNGVAQRGLLIRHLILPNGLAGTRRSMRFLAQDISPNTFVNIMGQYHPCWRASSVPEIDRPVTTAEVIQAKQIAREEGITRFDS